MAKRNQKEMDRRRADTDIASQCNDEKDGKQNPLIPPDSSCDIVEPADPKKPPQAQGTDVANVDGLTEAERSARAAMRKPGRNKPGRDNRTDDTAEQVKEGAEELKDKAADLGEDVKDKANDLGEDVKDKASDLGDDIKEKAEDGKDFIVEKYDEATASVDEQEHEDSFTFADHVIEKIAGIAAREIKGILALKGSFISNVTGGIMDNSGDPTRGVSVEVGDNAVVVSLKMIVEYGAPAPEIFKQLRQHVGQQLSVMTGLNLVELNVEVVDVMTREEFQQVAQSRFNAYNDEQSNYVNRYQNNYEPDNRGIRGRAPQGAPQGGFGY